MKVRWKRWAPILGGFALAQVFVTTGPGNCRINLPGRIRVDAPPVVVGSEVDDDDDDGGTCILADCD